MKKLDEFHYHEAIDRAHCISTMLDEFLISHPVAKKHKDIKKELKKAQDALWNSYQMIGAKSDKKFNEK